MLILLSENIDKIFGMFLRLTVSLQDVVSLPMLLVARHLYSPSSSGNISLIVSVATPFLYLRSMISDELSVCERTKEKFIA